MFSVIYSPWKAAVVCTSIIYFYCYASILMCVLFTHLISCYGYKKKMEIANLISSQSIVRKLRQKARMPEDCQRYWETRAEINTFKNPAQIFNVPIFPLWSFLYSLPQNNNLRAPGNLNDYRDLRFTRYIVASFLPELLQTASLSRVLIVIPVPHQWTSEMFRHCTWYS